MAVEFTITLEVHVYLFISDRKNVSNLRADADDAGVERADMVSAAAVAGELVIHIADCADEQLLGDKLRRAPIEVGIDAAGVSRRFVLEIPSESQDRREFVARLRIEIGVADSAVDGAVAETDICQIAGAVQADRNVAGQIGHVIIDAGIPTIGEHWNEIGEARRVLLERN